MNNNLNITTSNIDEINNKTIEILNTILDYPETFIMKDNIVQTVFNVVNNFIVANDNISKNKTNINDPNYIQYLLKFNNTTGNSINKNRIEILKKFEILIDKLEQNLSKRPDLNSGKTLKFKTKTFEIGVAKIEKDVDKFQYLTEEEEILNESTNSTNSKYTNDNFHCSSILCLNKELLQNLTEKFNSSSLIINVKYNKINLIPIEQPTYSRDSFNFKILNDEWVQLKLRNLNENNNKTENIIDMK